ncbi:MAG: peptidoglycan DD-metalloendopeptidase family protein, partial [Anaerolineales bacterium]|nr:peptidoglycan DD-metalloendopeptidase family protein [Anaerolineales bacterium]
QTTPPTHTVQPGDTWTALAMRYRTNPEDLRRLNPHLNQQRQPTIGKAITLPEGAVAQGGQLVRQQAGGLLAEAAVRGQNPWLWALQNGRANPYRPWLYEALWVADDDPQAVPRDLPLGLVGLELSQVPAYPGEGLAWRAQGVAETLEGQTTLGTAVGTLLANPENGRVLGLLATGAFYKPGEPELSIQLAGQPGWSQPWWVASDKAWTFNDITLTGAAAQIDQAAIDAERARLFELWAEVWPEPLWETPFQEPVTDYLSYSSFYGARRSYNGGPYRTYHEGLDFSAYGGTAVFAPARGVVVLAEQLYVRGGAVIIDHGLGIYSGVYHMSAVHVEPGQVVAPGDLVGEVGTTGLSTGNHLHWDVLVNGIWVDPMAWRESDMACWLLAGWGRPCVLT